MLGFLCPWQCRGVWHLKSLESTDSRSAGQVNFYACRRFNLLSFNSLQRILFWDCQSVCKSLKEKTLQRTGSAPTGGALYPYTASNKQQMPQKVVGKMARIGRKAVEVK